MAPHHTRVCGWEHITRKVTFLACVIELGQTLKPEVRFLACVLELGETGTSLIPTRCDDTTGNRPSYFLLGFTLTLKNLPF